MISLPMRRVRPLLLCIDDDPGIATILSRRLQDFEVDVACAFFGTEGIARAQAILPDVIITDMTMPQGGGNYVVECLRSSPQTCDIPAIVLTGRHDRSGLEYMMTLGVQDYLHKPLAFNALLRHLAKYIPLRYREIHWPSSVCGPTKHESQS